VIVELLGVWRQLTVPEYAGSQQAQAHPVQKPCVTMRATEWPVQPGIERLKFPLRFVIKAIAFHGLTHLPSLLSG
jgi:hypothetical protein